MELPGLPKAVVMRLLGLLVHPLMHRRELCAALRRIYMYIANEIDACHQQLYHINKFYRKIQVMESFAERQFQTVLFTTLMMFSAEFPRIRILFDGALSGHYWTLLSFNWVLTVWGIINSVIKYKDARRYPVTPGIMGQGIQIILVASLTVGRILFVTACLHNSPYFHPIGVVINMACISLFNK